MKVMIVCSSAPNYSDANHLRAIILIQQEQNKKKKQHQLHVRFIFDLFLMLMLYVVKCPVNTAF